MVVIFSQELTAGVTDVVNQINRGFTQEFQKSVIGSCKLLAVFSKDKEGGVKKVKKVLT